MKMYAILSLATDIKCVKGIGIRGVAEPPPGQYVVVDPAPPKMMQLLEIPAPPVETSHGQV
jgi:hypothetical protein